MKNEQKTQKNCVLYMRFSSANQNEQSIEGQREACNKYAKDNGLNILTEYIDRAKSGTNDDRYNFKQMLVDSKGKQFQYILVYQFDRFARNREDSAITKGLLKKNGIKVVSAKESVDPDDNSPISKLLEGILEVIAEFYSLDLGVKTKRGMSTTASKGYAVGCRVPFGYKTVAEQVGTKPNGQPLLKYRFTIDEAKAPYIKTIFEKFTHDITINDIIQYLNSEGVKTAKGKSFTKHSLYSIVTNIRYTGLYKWDNIELRDGSMPQIIDMETFDKAQAVVARNKISPQSARAEIEYILTQKLDCGECGNKIHGISGNSKTGKTHYYYSCHNQRLHKCSKTAVGKDHLENEVVRVLKDEVLTEENIKKIVAMVDEANKLDLADNSFYTLYEKRLNDLDRRNANYILSLGEPQTTETRQMIFAEIQKIAQEKADVQRLFDIEKSKADTLLQSHTVDWFLRKLQKCDTTKLSNRKALISALLNKVILYNDGRATLICTCGDVPITINAELIKIIEKNSRKTLANKRPIIYNNQGLLDGSSMQVSRSPKLPR